jgi:hypothetical protein
MMVEGSSPTVEVLVDGPGMEALARYSSESK